MIVLVRIQDAFTPLPLRVILIVSACFYMDMNCFGPDRVVSSWLRVGLLVANSFGWVVADGFGWLQMVSDGFGWFRVVCCFTSYVPELLSGQGLPHFSVDKLESSLQLISNEVSDCMPNI